MKNNVNAVWILISILFCSCSAHFDRFPGERLKEFPEEMQGAYIFHDKPSFFYLFKKDSAAVIISSNKISPVKGSEAAEGNPITLNDSNVFSKFGDHYALSQRDENIPG